ncbi:MAG: YitT family protein [Treponema sp.]|nr:YitT family protein [Treponema sp.]
MNSFFCKIKRLALVLVGAAIMAVNIKTFVHSGNLFPGGFTGLALLIQEAIQKFSGHSVPFSVLVYSLNVFPVVIGFLWIGKKFTFYSVVMIVVSGLLTDFFPGFYLTQDVLLCSIFGGILNAVSISLCLLAGSSSGGTDFIAIFIAEKTGKSAWNYILAFNVAVLLTAGLLFGWNAALYSIIFQFVSTQALNVLYKKYEKTTLLIITDKDEEIYKIIHEKTNHDATVFVGKGCFKNVEHKLLYTVVSSQESGALEKLIRKTDPNAFINVLQSKDIIGRFFKRAND